MRTLIDFSILQEYSDEVEPRGDKLSALAALVDWNAFLPIEIAYTKTRAKKAAGQILALL
jgi:hypothetical protein